MKQRIAELVAEASRDLQTGTRAVAISLMRILLQHACYSLAEWIVVTRAGADNVQSHLKLELQRLRQPSDGTLVQVLGELLIAAENGGWTGVSRPMFHRSCDGRPCSEISGEGGSLFDLLTKFVEFRNDGPEGHGLPCEFNVEADLDAVDFAAHCLEAVLPKIMSDGCSLKLIAHGAETPLRLLRSIDGHLVCIRKIRRTERGKCLVRAQVEKGLSKRDELTYEAPDLLSSPIGAGTPSYSVGDSTEAAWCPLVLIPDRVTDCFTGREAEMRELAAWADDVGSRACMLFGDGGIGKTTLVIEFLHKILEGSASTTWRPDAITYYTAKQTRWGLTGLERITVRDIGMMDVALDIVRALDGESLSREWFTKDPEELIAKLEGHLRSWGIQRERHLLVIDNTETMAASREDVLQLAKQIRWLTQRIGRVIITSRRREPIEARQIELEPWTTDESVGFLKARADVLCRRQILQAGDSTLRKYSTRLGNKPLIIEVFIQALEEQDLSLERAFERVLGMQQRDLGEFLYSDAWKRLSENLKHLLLLMTRLGDVHDEVLMKLCCLQADVRITEAYDALVESRGIATVSTIDDRIQVAFTLAFMKYCEDRTIRIRGGDVPTASEVEKVTARYWGFLKGQAPRIRDRISRAYRHPLARAAWLAFREGRNEDCESFYELAVAADTDNGWLFDRYAYFLFTVHRYEEALERAKRATSCVPSDPDAWFTRGMIEARLGFAQAASQSLTRAESFGKPAHLCRLQAAYGHVNSKPANPHMASDLLNESEKLTPRNDSMRSKHLEEVRRLRKRVKYLT